MADKPSRILFLVPYPLGIAPSQRFRFEQYFESLRSAGHSYTVRPFLDEEAMSILYQPGRLPLKIWKVVSGFIRRVDDLLALGKFDIIFIHREAAPIGPPILEWMVAKIWGKKIIFDFDDAIWIPNTSSSNPFISVLKRYRNAENTCAWAWKVSCGNAYLRDHASLFNAHAVINPTTIDTDHHHNCVKVYCEVKTIIGWTGTHSTIKYLDHLVPIFRKLESEFDFELLVIADRRPDFELRSLRFVPWNKATEINDLLQMDVGLMPLEDDRWAKGKCGFKALQYMALGIPAVVSPVGVNKEIVSHAGNGWICSTAEEWEECLRNILGNHKQLAEMSLAARETVIARYSVASNRENFLNLFQ